MIRDNEIYRFIAKLGRVREALHILDVLRSIHLKPKFRIDISITESGEYEKTVKMLRNEERQILKMIGDKIGREQLERTINDVETGLCLRIMRSGSSKLMHSLRARENPDESRQLKKVYDDVENLIEMIEKKKPKPSED